MERMIYTILILPSEHIQSLSLWRSSKGKEGKILMHALCRQLIQQTIFIILPAVLFSAFHFRIFF